jgi:hypothetical protein
MKCLLKISHKQLKKNVVQKKKCIAFFLEETFKLNTKWKKDYMKQGYKLMSRENIYTTVIKLLSKNN